MEITQEYLYVSYRKVNNLHENYYF